MIICDLGIKKNANLIYLGFMRKRMWIIQTTVVSFLLKLTKNYDVRSEAGKLLSSRLTRARQGVLA